VTAAKVLDVDGLRFTFDDSWSVAKWDDSAWFKSGLYKLNGTLAGKDEGTKALDIVGLHRDVPYLFEVKDFRGFAIESKARQVSELPLEIGLKARDTVAGLLGLLSSNKGRGDLPEAWVRAAQKAERRVHVLALLAEDDARPGEAQRKRDVRASERLRNLEKRLTWLTSKVFIRDPIRQAERLRQDYGITAESLPGAGPARSR
jgi:hypothetical protein